MTGRMYAFLIGLITPVFCFDNFFSYYGIERCFRRINGSYVMSEIQLSGQTRTDLKCRTINLHDSFCERFKNQLCACTTVPTWVLDNSRIGLLQLEYSTRRGSSRIMGVADRKEYDFYKLISPNDFLSFLPLNMCDFPTTVVINFAHNRITDLRNLGCIKRLTLLDLSHNRLSKIAESYFEGLAYLQSLDLSYNRISYIEPGTFNQKTIGLIHLDVSNNLIINLDISNIILPKTFCGISYAENQIVDFTNGARNPVKGNDTLGDGGLVDLSSNHVKRIPNPTRLGIGQGYEIYGRIFFNRFNFILHDNPLSCDCFMEEYLRGAKNILDHFAISGNFGYICNSPLRLRGTSIVDDIIEPGNLTVLTCSLLHSCPSHCSCYFESNNFIIIVDCTVSYNRTSLPSFNFTKLIENMQNHTGIKNTTISLRLSGGRIQSLDQQDYLPNISYVDLSYNNIMYIAKAAVLNFSKNIKVNLTGSSIHRLPREVRRLRPRNVFLNNTTLFCDCDLISWFPEWLQSGKNGEMDLNITCDMGKRTLPLVNITESDFDCKRQNEDYSLVFYLGGSTILVLIAFYFFEKYGVYGFVLYKSKIQNKEKLQEWFKYDIYISIDDNNEQVLRYVIREFIPMLQSFRLKSFLFARHSTIGGDTEECVIKNLEMSKMFVFFLTSTILTVHEQESTFPKEWKHAWNRYKTSSTHDIVMINFDLLRISDLKDKCMKAVISVGHHIRFCDVEYKDKLKKLLTKQGKHWPHFYDRNSKMRFALSSLNKDFR